MLIYHYETNNTKGGNMCTKFKLTTLLTVLLFSVSVLLPENSFAKWKDRSDELPGTYSTQDIVLYTVGALAVVTLIIVVAKSGKSKSNVEESGFMVPDSASSSVDSQYEGFTLATVKTNPVHSIQEPSFLPYVGLQSAPTLKGYATSKKYDTFVLGVSVKF